MYVVMFRASIRCTGIRIINEASYYFTVCAFTVNDAGAASIESCRTMSGGFWLCVPCISKQGRARARLLHCFCPDGAPKKGKPSVLWSLRTSAATMRRAR
jgi:hypothetical protein